ncbi:VOC family protein [Conexibacter sp. CPCC 206217]|uniref:VOC family protein n=1 Tax=Conexibacter sp. CPCC 206217 TaxID=3064574 RepID=UPI00272254F8|nr:VOC family protein [Conexibacter sp. CPCC 206217]MDO8212159.1 VOC family protein [Conexibacter sp. CPCC 206217]
MPHVPRIDHIAIGVSDVERSRLFYAVVLAPLGFAERADGKEAPDEEIEFGAGGLFPFGISTRPAMTIAPGLHVAFAAERRDQVDAFHAAALAAGGTDNGAPGLRPQYSEHYYGAFVLDPDGYNVEAVCKGAG